MTAAGRGKLHETVRKKYGNLKSVEALFETDSFGGKTVSGKLVAEKGNRFSLTIPGRQYISDGRTVWNVMDKTVTVDNFSKKDDNISIDDIFFDALNSFTLKEPANEESLMLTLVPQKGSSSASYLEYVEIHLNKKNDIITLGVKMQKSAKQVWKIKKLKRNPKIPSATFDGSKFLSGYEVIDLR